MTQGILVPGVSPCWLCKKTNKKRTTPTKHPLRLRKVFVVWSLEAHDLEAGILNFPCTRSCRCSNRKTTENPNIVDSRGAQRPVCSSAGFTQNTKRGFRLCCNRTAIIGNFTSARSFMCPCCSAPSMSVALIQVGPLTRVDPWEWN
jgi:hypothetical protein